MFEYTLQLQHTCTRTYGSKPSSYGMRYEMLVSNQRAWSVALRRSGRAGVHGMSGELPCPQAARKPAVGFLASFQERGCQQGGICGCGSASQQAQRSAPVPPVVVVHVEAAQLAALEQLRQGVAACRVRAPGSMIQRAASGGGCSGTWLHSHVRACYRQAGRIWALWDGHSLLMALSAVCLPTSPSSLVSKAGSTMPCAERGKHAMHWCIGAYSTRYA